MPKTYALYSIHDQDEEMENLFMPFAPWPKEKKTTAQKRLRSPQKENVSSQSSDHLVYEEFKLAFCQTMHMPN